MHGSMTPDQFLANLQKNGPAAAYLFLGPEAYHRERCRRELIRAALGDLSEVTLASALDDARAMSLFASRRLIWIANAEAALPRTRAAASDDEAEDGGDGSDLAAYLKAPTPGTVVVLDASRYGFEGEDKAKMERAQKFYAAISHQDEFRPYSPEAARSLAQWSRLR